MQNGDIDWPRVLGLRPMIGRIKQSGWETDDVREMVATLKGDLFDVLDDFAGGALSDVKGTPHYPLLLELTAVRYVRERHADEIRGGGEVPVP